MIVPSAKSDSSRTRLRRQDPQSPNSWDQIWQQIIRRREQERSRTSRGEICPVVPQFLNRRIIWRDRPVFVWQGNVESISVSDFAGHQQLIWQQEQIKNNNASVYVSQTLKPGTQYIWKAENGTQSIQVIFQVMGQTERDRITAQINQLEIKSASENSSFEEKLLQRVQFFLEQDLLLDAIQEIYHVSHPSKEIQALQKKIVELSCQKK